MGFPKLYTVAVALPAYCSKTGKMFGIRTEQLSLGEWLQTWAFEITEDEAEREKISGATVNGVVYISDSYNGCPHCGAKSWYRCGYCGTVGCLGEHETSATCPKCKNHLSDFTQCDNWDNLHGGGY